MLLILLVLLCYYRMLLPPFLPRIFHNSRNRRRFFLLFCLLEGKGRTTLLVDQDLGFDKVTIFVIPTHAIVKAIAFGMINTASAIGIDHRLTSAHKRRSATGI